MSDDTHGQWSEEIGDVVGTHPFASYVAKHAKAWRGCIPQVRPETVYTLLVGDILPPGTQSGTGRSHTIALDAQGWRDLAAAAARAAEMMDDAGGQPSSPPVPVISEAVIEAMNKAWWEAFQIPPTRPQPDYQFAWSRMEPAHRAGLVAALAQMETER